MRLALPLAEPGQVDVGRRVGDLVVTVGSYRRVIALPAMLGRFQLAGARLEAGHLQVAFRLDDCADRSPTTDRDDVGEGTG